MESTDARCSHCGELPSRCECVMNNPSVLSRDALLIRAQCTRTVLAAAITDLDAARRELEEVKADLDTHRRVARWPEDSAKRVVCDMEQMLRRCQKGAKWADGEIERLRAEVIAYNRRACAQSTDADKEAT